MKYPIGTFILVIYAVQSLRINRKCARTVNAIKFKKKYGGRKMGEHKYNPTAIKAKAGKLKPKTKKRNPLAELIKRYGLR